MEKKIEKLTIADARGKTIFTDDKYVIPLYQRAFAWTEKEICQLIDDIMDYEADNYYLGSLIVADKKGVYEVIDGQQRLTALFLLLSRLGYEWAPGRLAYECREKSNYTLNHLQELVDDEKVETKFANVDKIEQNIMAGAACIKNKLAGKESEFKERLSRVKLYRIDVPEHTDLNRYFEIMNVRGEQLEQHDILKAQLMEPLDGAQRHKFAVIWDACRNMDGYVQMHFYDKKERESLFGGNWDNPSDGFFDEFDSAATAYKPELSKTIPEIVAQKEPMQMNVFVDDDGNRIRFESIVDFPYFLLHVLQVFAARAIDNASDSLQKTYDDKKLLQTFNRLLKEGRMNNTPVDKKEFSLQFIQYLLKCRYLFDKYIIKREYKNEDKNGDWSLKELKVSGAKSKKKPYYAETYFGETNERQKTYKIRARVNLMLQACLRVSYTSPKNMHWITKLLEWLYDDKNLQNLSRFETTAEAIAKEPVKDFLQKSGYRQGVDTPHIVLNYLDYLLWKQNRNVDFKFEFRNSVEHWYPQHPSEQSFEKWDDVDRFGNLCLVQRDINAKFSNLSPQSKKDTYRKTIEKGSLKLREMSRDIDSVRWKQTACAEHEDKMLGLLRDACGDA